jgi:hypothetical protein
MNADFMTAYFPLKSVSAIEAGVGSGRRNVDTLIHSINQVKRGISHYNFLLGGLTTASPDNTIVSS